MSIHILKTQMWVPQSVRDTFAVFEDPGNLARITPPWLTFRIVTVDPAMRLGAVLDYQIRWNGIPMRWRSLIAEYEPPFFFVDLMTKGPFRLWRHRHTFHPTEEGTLVTDEVEYELPLGWPGEIVHNWHISKQLKDIFRYRQMSLNEMLAGGNARWTEPTITEKPPQSPASKTASRGTHTHVA